MSDERDVVDGLEGGHVFRGDLGYHRGPLCAFKKPEDRVGCSGPAVPDWEFVGLMKTYCGEG